MDPRFIAVLRPFLRFLADAPVTEGSPLRSLGLDSMKAIDLLFAIEDEFNVMLPDDMMNDATFETAGTLWQAVRDCLGDAATLPAGTR